MKIEYSGCKDTQKYVKSKIFPLIFFANVYVHRIFPKLKVFFGAIRCQYGRILVGHHRFPSVW